MKNRQIRVAIVHDALIEYGGGEKVLEVLTSVYPQADIYTSVINPAILTKLALDTKRLKGSFLANCSFLYQRPKLIQWLAPLIWLSFNFAKYDLVISHGGFYCSNMVALKINQHKTKHWHYAIAYPNSFRQIFFYLSIFNRWSWRKINNLAVVSKKIAQDFIDQGCPVSASVLYPPVSMAPAKNPLSEKVNQHYNGLFYVYAGRLVKSKNLSFLINAFKKNGRRLLIVGSGPEAKSLKKQASQNIEFLGFQTHEFLCALYQKAKAFVHPSANEDFGIAPVEAMACGLPVLAHHSGAMPETVSHGTTGYLFKSLEMDSFNQDLEKFEQMNFQASACRRRAEKFSQEKFKQHCLKLFK